MGKKLEERTGQVCVSLLTGLFLTCRKIITATSRASPTAFRLAESRGATSSLRTDGLQVPGSYVFRSSLEPCGIYCSPRTAFL